MNLVNWIRFMFWTIIICWLFSGENIWLIMFEEVLSLSSPSGSYTGGVHRSGRTDFILSLKVRFCPLGLWCDVLLFTGEKGQDAGGLLRKWYVIMLLSRVALEIGSLTLSMTSLTLTPTSSAISSSLEGYLRQQAARMLLHQILDTYLAKLLKHKVSQQSWNWF